METAICGLYQHVDEQMQAHRIYVPLYPYL